MIYVDVCWFTLIYVDLCWFVMIYVNLWWYMLIWHIVLTLWPGNPPGICPQGGSFQICKYVCMHDDLCWLIVMYVDLALKLATPFRNLSFSWYFSLWNHSFPALRQTLPICWSGAALLTSIRAKFVDLCQLRLIYVDLCWFMLIYVDLWWIMLTYCDICWFGILC